ncbi:hypothetical protein [Helicobacter cetorum]|uniref:Outer membrane protein n=1 Tax=Helicobacter cetorum (strain ATCC BAA-540 / CCUG 52418 / MIT 99-5656) TaxID=1163745 RepID=I0ES33_HELCM|nr:hypothetical protein [Helicobacter cetorum]AFI05752.1 outer membrane protein [Helicobacter cetorum MIT 99-5656]
MGRIAFLGLNGILLLVSVLNAKTPLIDLVQNANLDGFVFGRFTQDGGKTGNGNGFQFRIKADLSTGEYKGFSFTSGIFFSQGSGVPPKNRQVWDDIQGSRGVRMKSQYDIFSFNNLFVKKSLFKSYAQVGEMNLNTPFNDKSTDRAIGASFSSKDLKDFVFDFSAFGSWMADDLYSAGVGYDTNGVKCEGSLTGVKLNPKTGRFDCRGKTLGANTKGSIWGAGIGNALLIGGVGYGKKFGFENRHHFRAKLYDLYAHKLIDYMIFTEASYRYQWGGEHQFVNVLFQLATAGVNNKAEFQTKRSQFLATYFKDKVKRETMLGHAPQELAQSRGVYNFQVSVERHGFYAMVGTFGSFAQGYASLIDNVGGLKTAGKLWNGSQGHGSMGFGLIGGGATKNTSMYSVYSQLDYRYKNLLFALDLVFVTGKNNFTLWEGDTDLSDLKQYRGWDPAYRGFRATKNATFGEITPSIAYKVGNRFTAQLYYANLFGQIRMYRVRCQLTYSF